MVADERSFSLDQPATAHGDTLLATTEVPQDGTWTVDQAESLYRLDYWSLGFFSVSPHGDLLCHLQGADERRSTASIPALVEELAEEGCPSPVLFEFPDIARESLEQYDSAIEFAFSSAGFPGKHKVAYPLKTNQGKHVVGAILSARTTNPLALEISGAAELALAVALGEPGKTEIICHGAKAGIYLQAVEAATEAGFQVTVVIEAVWEADVVIERLGKQPSESIQLGLRVRPIIADELHDTSIFGLTAPDLVEVFARLRKAKLLDRVNLLHCHLWSGGQTPRLRTQALEEMCALYVALRDAGLPIDRVDVGGGSAPELQEVSNDASPWENFASALVTTTVEKTSAAGHPVPTIITENGRSLVEHSQLLVADVLGVREREASKNYRATAKSPPPLRVLSDLISEATVTVDAKACLEEALIARRETLRLFKNQELSLSDLAESERLLTTVVVALREKLPTIGAMGATGADAYRFGMDIYDLNISLFQSLPDTWALGHVFPVLPIEHLDRRPTRTAVLADLTCDEDGQVSRFIDPFDDVLGIPLHPTKQGRPYRVAFALVGAYQSALASNHNLFGKTARAVVSMVEGTPEITEVIPAEPISSILGTIGLDHASAESPYPSVASPTKGE